MRAYKVDRYTGVVCSANDQSDLTVLFFTTITIHGLRVVLFSLAAASPFVR